MFFHLLPLLFGFTAPVLAQTQAQIQACGNSVQIVGFDLNPTYSTTDTTGYSVTYSYSPSACTNPQVPVNSIYLTDLDAGLLYNCPIVQFSSSGSLTSTCSKTKGQLAQAAEDGDPDWGITIRFGVKPTLYNIENDFTVNPVDGPTPSGSSRRRRALEHNLKNGLPRAAPSPLLARQMCSAGHSHCRAYSRGGFECVNTASDVTACGACPMSAEAVDCTSIDGVNEVQCRSSKCLVLSCDRYHTVSSDGRSCVPNGKARRSAYL
ncbi:hypothetical protein TREMEDRAFT_70687 [Tremella mesenterica DSM 1558]|uniref:uncharacterized protein n=1 Tax=Tremella mesenterica (strain ATCC 24925 / CBS 8224 / DSM 1558 / NBRC 9311 / NRRL Y-6157 / RJB 2259-6 / UBC 559-6) TaxID=578456 RepID=UPI0003F48E5E|nr:uncharacterized protein TREMEDRAFT_70687 [Tremella mesenterica DSM 1558]EIW72343.1 hypothetical protein TREMEDRAFT_70687 [Tremella mesenterica DSM 1558]